MDIVVIIIVINQNKNHIIVQVLTKKNNEKKMENIEFLLKKIVSSAFPVQFIHFSFCEAKKKSIKKYFNPKRKLKYVKKEVVEKEGEKLIFCVIIEKTNVENVNVHTHMYH